MVSKVRLDSLPGHFWLGSKLHLHHTPGLEGLLAGCRGVCRLLGRLCARLRRCRGHIVLCYLHSTNSVAIGVSVYCRVLHKQAGCSHWPCAQIGAGKVTWCGLDQILEHAGADEAHHRKLLFVASHLNQKLCAAVCLLASHVVQLRLCVQGCVLIFQ